MGDTFNGRFGEYGGQYIPETLMNAVIELEEAYNRYKNDPDFVAELDDLFKNYAGRPSLLYEVVLRGIDHAPTHLFSALGQPVHHFLLQL